jgi:ABC-2 type transport system permease protein
MTATASAARVGGGRAALPSVPRLGLARASIELREFSRDKEALFNLGFPAMLLVLLASIMDGTYDNLPNMTASQVFAASMIAYGIVSTAFLTIGVGIVLDRENGTLKRLRGTTLTPTAYFIGKIILVTVSTVAAVVLLLAIGTLFFDLKLPSGAGRWLTFSWLLALSIVACTLLGIAASALVRSAKSASTILTIPVVALQFLSGIFVHPITGLPDWMVATSSILPVKWMGQGFRSVFLPDAAAQYEAAAAWEPGRTALVLGAWCVVGLVLCLVTFRWTNRKNG